MIVFIPTVEAKDMPEDVLNYCVDEEYSTHYQNDIVWIKDDGNPFAEWLKSQGFRFGKNGEWIGIMAT